MQAMVILTEILSIDFGQRLKVSGVEDGRWMFPVQKAIAPSPYEGIQLLLFFWTGFGA